MLGVDPFSKEGESKVGDSKTSISTDEGLVRSNDLDLKTIANRLKGFRTQTYSIFKDSVTGVSRRSSFSLKKGSYQINDLFKTSRGGYQLRRGVLDYLNKIYLLPDQEKQEKLFDYITLVRSVLRLRDVLKNFEATFSSDTQILFGQMNEIITDLEGTSYFKSNKQRFITSTNKVTYEELVDSDKLTDDQKDMLLETQIFNDKKVMYCSKIKLGDQSYSIQEKLGKGAFGSVFLVQDAKGQKLALKQIPQSNETSKLRDECNIANSMNCTYIPRVHSIGEMENEDSFFTNLVRKKKSIKRKTSYILMGFAKGKTLQSYVKDSGKFSKDHFNIFKTKLCLAYNELHGQGIYHLDLKTDNIFWDDQLKEITIIDFGQSYKKECLFHGPLGHPFLELHNGSYRARGAPGYIHPDLQKRGCSPDDLEKAESYALAITLLCAKVGCTHFELYNDYLLQLSKNSGGTLNEREINGRLQLTAASKDEFVQLAKQSGVKVNTRDIDGQLQLAAPSHEQAHRLNTCILESISKDDDDYQLIKALFDGQAISDVIKEYNIKESDV
ncbi:hypothetical protein DID75_04725 [Candidatus Marinamargulisbacteria bacterium SCGC AG-410-N11]|nr:hypothetical protein DID75_04725 [Candidatus Marinamargulisbacteria bacterium SCGC AG-410-N11]